MGHSRIRMAPRNKKWREVVDLLQLGAPTAQLTEATLKTSNLGLKDASSDPVVIHVFWLLAHLPKVAKSDNLHESLKHLDMEMSDDIDIYEFVSIFSEAVDRYTKNKTMRSDIGELAQMAAVESLFDELSGGSQPLFETTPDLLIEKLASLDRNKGFDHFARHFFGNLLNRYLNYFLSVELPNHVGPSRRFFNVDELEAFKAELYKNCSQASRIVSEFCGEWRSKTFYKENTISHLHIERFLYGAMNKLTSELVRGEGYEGGKTDNNRLLRT